MGITNSKSRFFCIFMALCLALCVSSCSDENDTQVSPEINILHVEETSLYEGNNTVGPEACVKKIHFESNTEWIMTVTDCEWITADIEGGNPGEQLITINIIENSTYKERAAEIHLKAGELEKEIKVIQRQNEMLAVSKKEFNLEANGGIIEFEVSSNIQYHTSVSQGAEEWLELNPKEKDNLFAFSVYQNNSPNSRTFTIKVAAYSPSSLEHTITVTQEGHEVFSISKEEQYNVSWTGEEIAIPIETNLDLSFVCSNNKCRASISGKTIIISVDKNTTFNTQNIDIQILNTTNDKNDVLDVINIHQETAYYIVDTTQKTLFLKEEVDITPELNPSIDFKTTFQSSDESVVIVDEYGKIKAISKGDTNIRIIISANGKDYIEQIPITVKGIEDIILITTKQNGLNNNKFFTGYYTITITNNGNQTINIIGFELFNTFGSTLSIAKQDLSIPLIPGASNSIAYNLNNVYCPLSIWTLEINGDMYTVSYHETLELNINNLLGI